MKPILPRVSVLLVSVLAWGAAAGARADSVTQRWAIAPDERPYVTTGNLERGIGYNPVTKNVLLLGRFGGPKVYVLNAADGGDGSVDTGEPRVLSLIDEAGEGPVVGGTFTLNLVGGAEDGAVYACNLATSLGTVRIYRWANDQPDTPVSVAYSGDPLEGLASPGTGQDIRFGDNFAVRGSGTGTQLIQVARNGKYVLIYTTTDGLAFTPKVFTSPALQGKGGLGVAFGAGNTFWSKVNGASLQRVQFDLGTGQLQVLGEVATTVIAAGVTGLAVDPVARRLATVDYAAHTLAVYDISDPAGPIPIGDPLPFPTANANANGTAAAALGGEDVFGLDTNNGLLAARIEKSVVADPPVIVTQPAGATVYAGGSHTFGVAAQGTPPFSYQWLFDDNVFLPGATNAQLTLTNLTPAQSGRYSVAITNAAGFVVSGPATLTVRETLATGVLKPLWSLNPGDRPYLTTDNTQRGVAWNPATGNVLLATRSPSNTVVVLDAATGATKHFLRNTTADDSPLFTSGTLVLNMIGVADDGVVYAANLVTDGATSPLVLYRWPNDGPDAVPEALGGVAELAIAERWGDTFDVRGRGASTQILLGTRGLAPQEGRKFAVLSTTDGFTFTGQIFTVADAPASGFGLGIAFGPGNTVFGTANGQPLVHAAFNPADGSAVLARAYSAEQIPTAVSFFGFRTEGNLLAAVALESPDNVRLYDLADLDAPGALDQQLILPEQPNVNGTGAVDFGGDRVFVLDTNHGLRAYEKSSATAAPKVSIAADTGGVRVTFEGTLQTATTVDGPWSDVGGATSPYSAPAAGLSRFYRARR
jgi:hypothetical protein